MKKRKKGIIATIVITSFVIFFYIILEDFFLNHIGCNCTVGFYPTMTSRLIGYVLLIISTIVFIASIWRIKKLSRLWTIPALIVFGVAFYGNGYALYTTGIFTDTINRATFFGIRETKLGTFTYIRNVDDLKTGKHNGGILGYSVSRRNLTFYRINEKPLNVKTRFLFWKICPQYFIYKFSPALSRNFEFEKNNSGFEFIGGKNMPIEAFRDEIARTEDFKIDKLKNQQIINETDGTTRFRFEIE